MYTRPHMDADTTDNYTRTHIKDNNTWYKNLLCLVSASPPHIPQLACDAKSHKGFLLGLALFFLPVTLFAPPSNLKKLQTPPSFLSPHFRRPTSTRCTIVLHGAPSATSVKLTKSQHLSSGYFMPHENAPMISAQSLFAQISVCCLHSIPPQPRQHLPQLTLCQRLIESIQQPHQARCGKFRPPR